MGSTRADTCDGHLVLTADVVQSILHAVGAVCCYIMEEAGTGEGLCHSAGGQSNLILSKPNNII